MGVAVVPAVIEALLGGSWLSRQSLSRRTLICQTPNHREVCWYGEHARDPVADRRRAAGVAGVPDRMPDAVQRRRRATPARREDPPRLLRDPGAPVRDARPGAADDAAGRGIDFEQEPAVARRGAAGATRLGPGDEPPPPAPPPAAHADPGRRRPPVTMPGPGRRPSGPAGW